MHHVLRDSGCYQYRMGRADVAANMIIHLVDSGQVGVVCKWLETLDRHECRETLLQLSLAIGRLKRCDVDAAVRELHNIPLLGSRPCTMSFRCQSTA